jgi:hypothetical protein
VKIRHGLLLIPLFLCAAETQYSFEDHGVEDWTAYGGGNWIISTEKDRGNVLHLQKSGPIPQTPLRRPANLLLLPAAPQGPFTLDLDVRTLQMKEKGADICLFYAVQDEVHYAYVHLSNDSDGKVHQVIMNVDGTAKTRTRIHQEKKPPPSLTGEWQHVRLIRDNDGNVQVYVDDMTTPVMTTQNSPAIPGRIGIGSFNDRAQFDNITLTTP